MLILESNFITSRDYTVTYYQTLEEVPWFLRFEKFPKNDKNLQKT